VVVKRRGGQWSGAYIVDEKCELCASHLRISSWRRSRRRRVRTERPRLYHHPLVDVLPFLALSTRGLFQGQHKALNVGTSIAYG
jgi:hypothetical protein